MNTRNYLIEHLTREAATFWGEHDSAYLAKVADDWLDNTGASGPAWRIDKINTLFPDAHKILDLGAGCGTFVHYALRQGYDAFGIEPESWKLSVVQQLCASQHDLANKKSHILASIGERLPFADNTFDCVATFQTIEHVQDVAACCAEMLRVTRVGGGIHIRCPDYAVSTYEGHYRLPWLPLLRGKLAEWYLKKRGKPVAGWRSLQMVSAKMLTKIFIDAAESVGYTVRVVDVDFIRVCQMLHIPAGTFAWVLTRLLFVVRLLRMLFRADAAVHLAVFVEGKS